MAELGAPVPIVPISDTGSITGKQRARILNLAKAAAKCVAAPLMRIT